MIVNRLGNCKVCPSAGTTSWKKDQGVREELSRRTKEPSNVRTVLVSDFLKVNNT